MASVDHLVEALEVMVDQQNTLQNFLAQLAQQPAISHITRDRIFNELTKPCDTNWIDVAQIKNLKQFAGDPSEREEFSGKFKVQVTAS